MQVRGIPLDLYEAGKAPANLIIILVLDGGTKCSKHFGQISLVWVVKRRSCYPSYLDSNPGCDKFVSHGSIGVPKVPAISLSLKCLRVGQDISKHLSPKGLA